MRSLLLRFTGSAVAMTVVATMTAGAGHAAPIRSDVPLWPSGGDNVWPQAMTTEIGVMSIVRVGDWRLRYADCDPQASGDECFSWLRISFASVIHGGFYVTQARTRKGLADAIGEPASLVALPKLSSKDGGKAFAIQIGFRGGSRYMLLRAHGEPVYAKFDVLDGTCERAGAATWTSMGYRQRQASEHGYMRTDYCAVRTANGLERLMANTMEAKPEQSMEFVGPTDETGQKANP